MDFAPTAWVVQTVRAYPELAVFLANRRTAEASVSGGELVDWILTFTVPIQANFPTAEGW